MRYTILAAAIWLFFVWAIIGAYDHEQARAGEPPRELRQAKASYGTGQIAWAGKGPEAWHYAWVKEKRRTKWLQRRLTGVRRELKRRWQPTVDYAYRLAATTYGVPAWELRAVGSCESHHYPFARNGIYRGVMQTGPMFERGPYGRAGFSVWDPVANVMTAAHARVADGSWRQWACKP